jgi:predicted ATPase/class 3 adenylate cyclase
VRLAWSASYAVLVPTVTFLFTDIEGSTALLRQVGDGVYGQVLADHHGLIRSVLAAHGGREVDTQGDAFFAVFSSPRDCAAAVLQMQRELQGHSWPAGKKVRVRMGLHTGEASQTPAGLVGLDVHRAARIAAVAYGGQVVVSQTAAALLRDVLPPGAVLTDLGEHRLKDLGRPERIFQLHAAGLPAEFPPLRSLGNPALLNNLPAQLSAFIGRAAELAEVRRLMESSRLVTLAGPGGAGKTRLALQAAAELLDGSGDGVWLAELASVTSEDAVSAAVCDALRIPAQADRPAVDVLAAALAPQQILIVLDNCEHLIGGCAKMADTILRRCPRVHLLATSREPLGIDGETVYRVPPLSLPDNEIDPATAESYDAVALFAIRARAHGVELAIGAESSPLIVSVCRQLDGLPLAIELAAARLRSMSLGELHDRLHDRFRLLTSGSRTAAKRQQTLLAAVDWSYSLLTGAEQAVLQRLSVFADGFDLDAAEAVCGFDDIDAQEVASLLGSLVDKSLVRIQHLGRGLRYRLLETIRQYAAEQLAGAGAEAANSAHCLHFLGVAEAAGRQLDGKEQVQAAARLNADQANIWRALEHAASGADQAELALRFAVAIRRWWPTQPELGNAATELLLHALEQGASGVEPRLYVAALIAGAGLVVDTDPARAVRLAEQALGLARRLGDNRLLAQALACLGGAFAWAGEPARGQPYALEAVELARPLADDVLIARCIIRYSMTGRFTPDEARPLYAEAIARSERSGDSMTRMEAHANAAADELDAGDVLAARAHAEEALVLGRSLGHEDATFMNLLGFVLRAQHDPAAQSTLEAALQLGRRHGDHAAIASSFLGLACLAADVGDWQRAAELHGVAQAARNRGSMPWQLVPAARREESIAVTRSGIGDEQFERAYAHGLSLGLAEAFELAARS